MTLYLFIYIVKNEKKKRVVANSTSIFCLVCFPIYYVFNGMLNWLPKSRDGNLNPIRGYPARSDPNGPDFTRSDKE